MYRELDCQHHLVQEDHGERPAIPGLTPIGFERWVTLLIQAHPDEEYNRLQKAVLTMPISNPEDRKERFPKEISRRLFPTIGDRNVCERLDDAIGEHAQVDLPKRANIQSPVFTTDEPPPNRRDAGGLGTETKVPQRKRNPFVSPPGAGKPFHSASTSGGNRAPSIETITNDNGRRRGSSSINSDVHSYEYGTHRYIGDEAEFYRRQPAHHPYGVYR